MTFGVGFRANVACFYFIEATPHHLPQVAVRAHSTILSTTSRTTLTQTFSNPNDRAIEEATYVFPLYEGVSVVRFKATIGERVIEGVVKEREEAKQEYEAARDAGFAAALMEQATESADVFTTKVGNIPANSSFHVDIEFIGELKQDLQTDGIRMTLPTELFPRYGDTDVSASNVSQADNCFSATIDIQLPEGVAIKSLQSPSHTLDVAIGNTSVDPDAAPSFSRASATIAKKESWLDTDFVVIVTPSKTGEPTALLETHATLPNQRVLMTSLVPKFVLPAETPEVVFVCDRSGSMQSNIPDLKNALHIFLKSLPPGVCFNICSFGTRCSFLWKKSRLYDQQALDEAIKHVATFNADYGGTEMYKPIEETFDKRRPGMNLEVFVLTDGGIWNEQKLFGLINEQSQKGGGNMRVFSLGIGSGASTSLVEGIARAGNGFAQFVADGENMDKKVVRMLKASLFPHITDFKLELEYEGGDGESDDFELVDVQSTIVESDDESKSLGDSNKPAKASNKTISLFDVDAKIDDAPPPVVQDLPKFAAQPYVQTPSSIPPLFPGSRSTVYALLNEGSPSKTIKSVALVAPSQYGELRLAIPVCDVGRGTTLHQLAARRECQELEEGRGFISRAPDAKGKTGEQRFGAHWDKLLQREAVYYGLRYQVASKWCSFVAIERMPDGTEFEAGSTHEKTNAENDILSLRTAMYAVQTGPNPKSLKKRSAPFAFKNPFARSAAPPPGPANAPRPSPFGGSPNITNLFGGFGGKSAFGRSHNSGGGLFGSAPAAACAAPAPAGFGGYGGSGDAADGGGLFGSAPSAGAFSNTTFGSAPSAERSSGLFGSVAPPAVPAPAPAAPAAASPAGPPFGGYGAAPQAESVDVAEAEIPGTPLERLTALQRFDGSWAWTAELERIVGVSLRAAAAAAPQLTSVDDALTTALAVAYFRTKLVDDEDVWELMVAKADTWLAGKVPDAQAAIEALKALIK